MVARRRRLLSIWAKSPRARASERASAMTEALSIEELDRRIAIVRENLRQLIEQAAARSGAADEALASDRISQQSEELDRLTRERDALLAAQGRKA
jgi:hypothetical protein